MFKRRLGLDTHSQGHMTSGASGCPDLWELADGNIAIIGLRKTSVLKLHLPATAGCGIDEEIVVVPRSVFIGAKSDLAGL